MVETVLKYPNCLRKAIDESGLTVREVAEGTMIPLRTIFHYCTGQVPIPRKRLEALAAFIGYSTHDLVPSRIGTNTTNMLQSKDKQAHIHVSLENESALDKLRRQFLQLLLSGTSATLVVPSEEVSDPDAWERLTWTLKNPYRTDTATVTHLEALTDTYWELYRSALAKIDLLSSISGHLLTVTRLLQITQPVSIQKRLCSIASNTAQMIGEVYFDMNDLESADHYYTLAIEAARQADNPALWSIALGRQGFLSVYEGAFLGALPFFQHAYSLAENTTTGKSKSWLTMMEAEAVSSLKRKDDCFALLEKTEAVYTQDRSPTGADRRWTGFSQTTMMGYKGMCYVRLHIPEKARSFLQMALTDLPSGPTRRRSLILADIATTYIQQEEIEEACTVASQALVYAAQTKSSRALQRLRVVQKDLRGWRDVSAVKRLNEQLRIVKSI